MRLYGFFGAFGEASIHAGRLFGWQNVEASEASSVSIHDDMAWTAQFYVYGAVTGESEFQVAFTQEIPAGTDLTLAVKGDDGYTYYYYKVKTAARMVFLKDFAQMGTTKAAPVFTNGAYELLLAVDFAQATKEPSRGDATLQLVISGNVMDVATVSYEIETPEPTKIQIRYGTGKSMIQTESIIDAPIRHADKDVYAIIVFDRQLPLNALIKLNGKTGKTIGGRAILFDLGEMSEWKDGPCILTCENLREGVNTVECYLAIVDETSPVNDPGKVFVNVIQYGTKGKLSITATKEEPEMKVAIKTMDGVETARRIVKGGSRIVFDIVENVDTISVTAYTADGTSAAQWLTYNVDTKTLSVAEDIPSGAYVVTFGFAEHIYDDVSFSFVVK